MKRYYQYFITAAWFVLSLTTIRSALDPISPGELGLFAFLLARLIPTVVAVGVVGMFLINAAKLYHQVRLEDALLKAFQSNKQPPSL